MVCFMQQLGSRDHPGSYAVDIHLRSSVLVFPPIFGSSEVESLLRGELSQDVLYLSPSHLYV